MLGVLCFSLFLVALVESVPTEDKTFSHHYHVRTQIFTNEEPVPYPVKVEKEVPYRVEVPVERPVPVHIPKPYPVIIEKEVPTKVEVKVPELYPVVKEVPVPVYIEKEVPYSRLGGQTIHDEGLPTQFFDQESKDKLLTYSIGKEPDFNIYFHTDKEHDYFMQTTEVKKFNDNEEKETIGSPNVEKKDFKPEITLGKAAEEEKAGKANAFLEKNQDKVFRSVVGSLDKKTLHKDRKILF